MKINVFSQLLPNLALSGGPTAGWFIQNTDDLNAELKKGGFPTVDKGFFTLGGGGFIDLPLKKNFLRIGGMGVGFSTHKELRVNDSLNKALTYSMGMGGLSVEYVLAFGNFDISIGSAFTTGQLSLDLYQNGSNAGSYPGILGEYTNNSSSQNITRNFRLRFYSAQPQAGIGLLTAKFIYFRLTAGYVLSTSGSWKVDNDVEVPNFPKGIKADGFNISLGINAGLFFRD
ncbi:MAG: hypothetical protein EHM58_01050 [Ignavibacteriae bacterium]|nr:MAG: hypothetical protein EHM58_01050 [Ignavibacteriota bacterium]